ncbi:hypothetical protein QYE76_032070 [Lolium multiflorum]|uniref:Polyprotein n=1 Tax=Lolium multiflorum TaxID=4521 RepID=A0AAD8QV37_LOLMU|nr:hypothetical protein QYE76_032070 [Lolium multiflorum]
MSSTPVLQLPDFQKQFVVETDACDLGIGAVLMQDQHPLAFLSKPLSSTHRQLSIYEKEFLALLMAVERWRPYLQRGFDVILVVVDRFTKYSHFVPLRHPFTAPKVARVFVDNVVKLHGMPHSITSDRDCIFTSHFWKKLFAAVGTKLQYTTAYHPQTDGQKLLKWMKIYADTKRSERVFEVGDKVLLKLQPYAQATVVNRKYPKLAYKHFGPYKVLERIGQVAYRLELPPSSQVHNVFHVSQIKEFRDDYSPVFAHLPKTPVLDVLDTLPEKILDRRLVKKGNAAIPQVLVKWTNVPEDSATWENWETLKVKFPTVLTWGQASSSGGGPVTPDGVT